MNKDHIKINTTHHYGAVRRFMELAGQATPDTPVVLDDATRLLRAKLIMEEALETIRGLGVSIMCPVPSREQQEAEGGAANFVGMVVSGEGVKLQYDICGPFDLKEVVDGCCDVAVVTTGTLIACGVPDEYVQDMVNANNLAKFGPGGYRADGTDAKPGPVGKWMKPPGHKPPDIAGFLADLGYAL